MSTSLALGVRVKRKYLIVNAFSSRNAGDAAIVLSTADLLRRNGALSIQSATRYHDDDSAFYSEYGVETVPPVIPFPRREETGRHFSRAVVFAVGALAITLLALLYTVAPRLAKSLANNLRLTGLVELFMSDRAVICGGGYLYSSRRPLNLTLVHTSLCTKVCRIAGKNPVMMPQSVGPFTRRSDRAIVEWSLNGVTPLVVRDESALAEAEKFEHRSGDVKLCPDVALVGWNNPGSDHQPTLSVSKSIGIAPMDWTWARQVDNDVELSIYIERLAAVSSAFAERGYDIRLYGSSRMPEMGQGDLDVCRRIADLSGHESVLVDPEGASGNAHRLFDRFADLSVVVGTRLHASIIALAAGTPAVALAYQPKSTGTYRQLGLERFCLDVQTFEVDRTVELVSELSQEGGESRAEMLSRVSDTQHVIASLYQDLLRP